MTVEGLPWRGPGPERPELPVPPGKVPTRRNGNWRKRWRYLGAFSDELLICAARVQVGPVGQTFWAITERADGVLHERTRTIVPGLARGEVWTQGHEGGDEGRIDWAPESGGTLVRIEAAERSGAERVRAFLHAGEGAWVEAICPTPQNDNYVWTRKRVVTVECDVRIGERRIRASGRGVEDESCGYHPHRTVWDWSAGVGETRDGRALGWNLVAGINDPERGSERAIWVDGVPVEEPPPARFDGLEAVEVGGARLEFSAESELRKEQGKPFPYSYRQPFGSFAGTLPGGLELGWGLGVMEHHEASW